MQHGSDSSRKSAHKLSQTVAHIPSNASQRYRDDDDDKGDPDVPMKDSFKGITFFWIKNNPNNYKHHLWTPTESTEENNAWFGFVYHNKAKASLDRIKIPPRFTPRTSLKSVCMCVGKKIMEWRNWALCSALLGQLLSVLRIQRELKRGALS